MLYAKKINQKTVKSVFLKLADYQPEPLSVVGNNKRVDHNQFRISNVLWVPAETEFKFQNILGSDN